MIEAAIAKNFTASNPEWNDWFSVRDSFAKELSLFIDDKLRAHSRGVVEFEAADNKYYIVLRQKIRLNHITHIVFYKEKGGAYTMFAIKNGVPVSKGLMMLAFSEALSQK